MQGKEKQSRGVERHLKYTHRSNSNENIANLKQSLVYSYICQNRLSQDEIISTPHCFETIKVCLFIVLHGGRRRGKLHLAYLIQELKLMKSSLTAALQIIKAEEKESRGPLPGV